MFSSVLIQEHVGYVASGLVTRQQWNATIYQIYKRLSGPYFLIMSLFMSSLFDENIYCVCILVCRLCFRCGYQGGCHTTWQPSAEPLSALNHKAVPAAATACKPLNQFYLPQRDSSTLSCCLVRWDLHRAGLQFLSVGTCPDYCLEDVFWFFLQPQT